MLSFVCFSDLLGTAFYVVKKDMAGNIEVSHLYILVFVMIVCVERPVGEVLCE